MLRCLGKLNKSQQGNWALNRLRARLFVGILKQEGGWLDGSGESEHIHMSGPCPLERPGAGLGRGSRRDNVIDD
jgi:hypothetical protein